MQLPVCQRSARTSSAGPCPACFASPPACMTELLLLTDQLRGRRRNRLLLISRAVGRNTDEPIRLCLPVLVVPHHCLPAWLRLSTCPSSPVDPFFFAPTFFFSFRRRLLPNFLCAWFNGRLGPVPPSSSVAATTRHHRADKNKKAHPCPVSPHQSILAASRTSERSSCAASPPPNLCLSRLQLAPRSSPVATPHYCHL